MELLDLCYVKDFFVGPVGFFVVSLIVLSLVVNYYEAILKHDK